MQRKRQLTKAVGKLDLKKSARHLPQGLVTAFALAGCGKDTPAVIDLIEPVPEPLVVPPNDILSPTLVAGTNYTSPSNNTELISTTYAVLKTIATIIDVNTTDADVIDVITDQNVVSTPEISGFEFINFDLNYKTSVEQSIINLNTISNFDTVTFANSSTDTKTAKISVLNASGKLKFDNGFTGIDVYTGQNENIEIETSENSTINIPNSSGTVTINGGGKSVDVVTLNVGKIDISNNSGITLKAEQSSDSLNLVSNGAVKVSEAAAVTGNITISAIGTIDLQNASSAAGKLNLENLRALPGSDITISNASSAKSVDIKSAGAVTASLNNGLKSAETISITAAENSNIIASSNTPKAVSLSAINQSTAEVVYEINIDKMETLALGGSAPILINTPGDDLNKTIVTTTNTSTVTINMTSPSSDVSNIASGVELRLPNLDGEKITVGNNQNLAVDAEVAQTAFVGTTEYQFTTPATSTSSNTVKITTIDTVTTNTDTTANIAGLTLSDIQTLNIDLSSSVGLKTSQDIVGTDLKTVVLTGSGGFDLGNSTIVGLPDGTVSLNSSNFTGNLTISVDNTDNGVKNITSGSGSDTIKIDGVNSSLSSSGRGISINTGSGHDTVTLTANADGRYAKVIANGGDGTDTASFDAALDFSLSDLALINFEILDFAGGSGAVKLPSNVLSGTNHTIVEKGNGTLTLEVFPTAQTVNLSSLVFDSSIVSGADKLVINGSNFSNALAITGSTMDDVITGTFTSGDTINSGAGNDTINGRDGNDIITPGDGTDHITPGLGNDTVNLAESVAAVDTLYYSIDDGVTNIDTVNNFDVRIANDVISLDISETTKPITFGNGSAASAAALGTIGITEHSLDTDLNFSSNAATTIIKLTQTDKSDFAKALGTGEITVANNAIVSFLWFDNDTKQAVFGYSEENSDTPAENKIKDADTFTEIVRLNMTESSYIHFLDADNFVFI
jgi:hypothetical protein